MCVGYMGGRCKGGREYASHELYRMYACMYVCLHLVDSKSMMSMPCPIW